MATLYELTGLAAGLMAMLEAGEIDEQTVQDTLDAMMVPEKLEDCCKMLRQLQADAEDYNRERKFYAKKKQRAENAAKRTRNSLAAYMAVMQKKKQQAGVFELQSRTSKSVDIYNQAELPEAYMKPQPPTVDKKSIREALQAGQEVAGAALIEPPSCVIK